MFRSLISVNGIGPRLAQNILSGISSIELRGLITASDTTSLTRIPGIGKKTAERIVIELRERLAKETGSSESISVPSRTPMAVRSEALEAMLTLGFQRSTAEKAIRSVLNEQQGEDLSVEELLRKALRVSGSR
jgi:Holliday junction DNA helicase RuvA